MGWHLAQVEIALTPVSVLKSKIQNFLISIGSGFESLRSNITSGLNAIVDNVREMDAISGSASGSPSSNSGGYGGFSFTGDNGAEGNQNLIRQGTAATTEVPGGVVKALGGIAKGKKASRTSSGRPMSTTNKASSGKTMAKNVSKGMGDGKKGWGIAEKSQGSLSTSNTGEVTKKSEDTTSYILQYWKNGIPMGGSGAGINAGKKGANEAAKNEMKNSDLDSIQVTKMYD